MENSQGSPETNDRAQVDKGVIASGMNPHFTEPHPNFMSLGAESWTPPTSLLMSLQERSASILTASSFDKHFWSSACSTWYVAQLAAAPNQFEWGANLSPWSLFLHSWSGWSWVSTSVGDHPPQVMEQCRCTVADEMETLWAMSEEGFMFEALGARGTVGGAFLV